MKAGNRFTIFRTPSSTALSGAMNIDFLFFDHPTNPSSPRLISVKTSSVANSLPSSIKPSTRSQSVGMTS
jgi:hypothetical protein